MERSVKVEIFGASYIIKTNEDPEYTKKLVQYVDQKMREVTSTSNVISTGKIAVLVAMNMADELFRLKEEIEEKLSREVTQKSNKLINLIDASSGNRRNL
ncbi:MAG: cell division protein ZapA [Nitrospinota bacterium]